jgi:hypothetical protein
MSTTYLKTKPTHDRPPRKVLCISAETLTGDYVLLEPATGEILLDHVLERSANPKELANKAFDSHNADEVVYDKRATEYFRGY